ncbi:MAG: hypothetical protein M3033_17340 [Acidobacteriota bacterium]|nr:hypothetical protein [Acidobacteriota bacterium]
MKKIIASLLVLFVFMVSVPLAAEAQCSCNTRSYRTARYTPRYRSARYVRYAPRYRTRYVPRYQSARYAPRYRTYSSAPRYRTAGYTAYNRPSFYRRHRNLINVGIATGAGALIGGVARGRRGAGIGALSGAGAGALYTYVLNKKKRRY